MAIATLQGHTQRAIDFYNKSGKFFVIGGTSAWVDESSPDSPSTTDYKLKDIVAYKKVDDCYLVIPVTDEEIERYGYTNIITYRTQKWRIVLTPTKTSVSTAGVPASSHVIPLNSMTGMVLGSKVRVNNSYEGTITAVNAVENTITLDTPAPSTINGGAVVETGALVEGAKYVYVGCSLNYDQFPVDITYRQIGLCTEVTPEQDVLRAAAYSTTTQDEFTSVGVLEVLDNRSPSTRDVDQRELLSLILEY